MTEKLKRGNEMEELKRCMNAIYLELPQQIADDVNRIVQTAIRSLESRLEQSQRELVELRFLVPPFRTPERDVLALKDALREAVGVMETVEKVTSMPGMEDPFINAWRWRYRLQDLLPKLRKLVEGE